jgi:hypothetical protein
MVSLPSALCPGQKDGIGDDSRVVGNWQRKENRRVPPESPKFSTKFGFWEAKPCVCSVRRLQPVVLLTEGL